MVNKEKTRIYNRKECIVFCKTHEAFGGLSNMASGYPIYVNNVLIRTSEALYQACRFPDLPDIQRTIIEQTSPMTAKMKSKPYRKNTRNDWDNLRIEIMNWCIKAKLISNWHKFGNLLKSTSGFPIVEESRKDDFWGAKPTDEVTLIGFNALGRLLMLVREIYLRSDTKSSYITLAPPKIDNFLLYGEPIQKIRIKRPNIQELYSDISYSQLNFNNLQNKD